MSDEKLKMVKNFTSHGGLVKWSRHKTNTMDLLFGEPSAIKRVDEDLVLELLNCSFFVYSQAAGKWIRQTPEDFNRVLIFRQAR